MKLTGNATIRVDGEELLTDGKGTFNPGGMERDPKVGANQVNGYTEQYVAPELTVVVHHGEDTDIVRLSNITNATVIFRADTGQTYMLSKAFTKSPVPLDVGNGTSNLVMSCHKVSRI